MAELTPQQRLFVAEYLVDKNATKAAERAGYTERSAYSTGHRLLKNAEIARLIEEGLQKQEKRTLLTGDRVLRELCRIAFLDPRKIYQDDGTPRPIKDLPADVARAIVGVDIDEIWEGYGEDRQQTGVTKKLKFGDKVRALELLGKHFKLFTDKLELDIKEPLAEQLQKARERLKKGAK